MFTAKVYTVMIGSLSGTMEEVFTAKDVVRKYNQENGESSEKLFLPVEWSMKPEDLQKVDVVIGIVGNWIGNSELIEVCSKAGKRVLLFFNAYQDPKNTIQSESETVKAFRKSVQGSCHCVTFKGSAELVQLLGAQLNSF